MSGPASAGTRKAVLHVTYVGVATTHLYGLEPIIQQARSKPPPTLGAYFGTYDTRVSWVMHGVIPVQFTDASHTSSIAQRGPAKWTTATSNGRVSVDPVVGCPAAFGDACPKANQPHQQPCTTNAVSMYQPWAKSVSGGLLDTGLKRSFAVLLHLPSDADALITPQNQCANFVGGTGNVGPIGFKPPTPLNGGATPKFPPSKLRTYETMLAPVAELRFSKSNQLTTSTFNFDFDWSWKAAGNQIGNPAIPATGQYWTNRITITSHVTVTESPS